MDDGVILLFKRKPKRQPHPLFQAYWDFWNPFFSWQELIDYQSAITDLTASSTEGDAA